MEQMLLARVHILTKIEYYEIVIHFRCRTVFQIRFQCPKQIIFMHVSEQIKNHF